MNDFMDDFRSSQTNDTGTSGDSGYSGTSGYDGYGEPPRYKDRSTVPDEFSVVKPTRTADGYELKYGEFEMDADQSIVWEYMKVVLAAMVGALPGIILWVILGNNAVSAAACGFILAGGVVAGFTFMCKDHSPIGRNASIIICLAVILVSVYIAQQAVWASSMAKTFSTIIPKVQKTLDELNDVLGNDEKTMKAILGENSSFMKKDFTFNQKSFWGCFFNIGTCLDYFGLRAQFYKTLFTAYVFAAVGGGSLFYKFFKSR